MSVSFGKNGIVTTSGIEVGENLIINSSGYNGINAWNISKNNSLSVVDEHDMMCFKLTSTSSDSNRIYIYQSLNSKLDITNLKTYTISFYYKAESSNNTSGVGAFVRIANSSSMYNDRINSTSSLILDNNWHFKTLSGDLSSFNGTNVNNVTFFLFAYKASVLYAMVKLEEGSISTPWIPNTADYGVVPTQHGFAEQDNLMKVYEDYITTTEFIEY